MRSSLSSFSSRGGSSASSSASEPLIDPVAAGPSTAAAPSPLLYAAIFCEDTLRVEASLESVALTARPSLRAAALRTETSLQRSVSFVSKDESLPRRSSISGANRSVPAAIRVHVLRRHGHAFCVLTLKSFEEAFASRFCEEVCAAYASAVMALAQSPNGGAPPSAADASGGGGWRRSWRRRDAAADEPAVPNFATRLGELLVLHGKPERLARLRRLREVADATDEVASVMEDAVSRMLATGQNLDVLEDKSEWLLAQASAFQRSASSVRMRYCCRNYKLACCIWSFVLAVVAIGTLFVLQETGVIHLWPGGDHPPGPPAPPPHR